jgi:nickel-dependent lactate racemase
MTSTLDAPRPSLAARVGGPDGVLTDDEVSRFVHDQLSAHDVDGRSVCILVPDGTRTCPLPLLLKALHGALVGRASRMTVVVALGTHAAMSDEALARHLGYAMGELDATYPGLTVKNHEWWNPETFADLGVIPAARLSELSEGRMDIDVQVRLNPGVAGQEIIDISHWLGALITSAEIIGTTATTPVRALIDEGASLIPAERLAFCVVGAAGDDYGSLDLHSVSFGDTIASWASAAEVCAATHVTYLDEPVSRVLSLVPEMYADIWTGAKGFYQLEPVVADGGEVILYAPHITTISAMHPEIAEIGYHCRDYFVKQWDRFKDIHWGVLAHSTHLRGAGTYDAETAEERLRVQVTLATGIPEDVCRAANLDYLDPATVDVASYEADPDTLVVPRAGEVLFRLR